MTRNRLLQLWMIEEKITMAGLYEKDQVGQRQDIADIVANIESVNTPFVSMLKKEKKPNQKKMDYQTEAYPDVAFEGIMDGADVDAFESIPRGLLTAMQQKFRRPWKVSDFADETEVAGLPKGEKGRQKAAAAQVLKFMLENRFLGARHREMWRVVSEPEEILPAILASPDWNSEARSFALVQ